MMKISRAGFTLAEVLTTLMVIGVVAAMTIPTLMNSTEDQQRKVALRKAVSVLGQAVQLNKAKEVECTINNGATLAACVANSLAGSRNGDVITTADGMAYKFYAKNGTTYYSLEDACGLEFGTSQSAWRGANACGVIVDINGATKGVSFTSTEANAGGQQVSILPTFSETSGFSKEPGQKDLYSLIMTDAGVRPTFMAADSRGYGFLYGEPSSTTDVFAASCKCTTTTTDESGQTVEKVEYKNYDVKQDGTFECPTGCTEEN